MKDGIQDILLDIGRSGCYFLCLLKIAEFNGADAIDIVAEYQSALKDGTIKRNCFVENGRKFLEEITDRYVSYRWENADYTPSKGEWVIKRYVIKSGAGALTHFVLFDDNNSEIFNPTPNSPAYKHGKVDSCRVYEVGV